MPIGIVSDEDFLTELNKLRGTTVPGGKTVPIQGEIVETPKRGRKEGTTEVPDSLRKIIGETSVIEGRQSALALAADWGISPSSVSAYAKGATSTSSYDKPKQSILEHINKSRARAVKKATHVMNRALESITQEKLDYTDADKLSGIAKDMSAIIKNLEPQKEVNSDVEKSAPQFVIFAPQFRDERSFETIQVKE